MPQVWRLHVAAISGLETDYGVPIREIVQRSVAAEKQLTGAKDDAPQTLRENDPMCKMKECRTN